MKKCLIGVADSKYLSRYAVTISSMIDFSTTFDLDVKLLAIDCDAEQEDTLLLFFRSNFPNVSFEIIRLSEEQKTIQQQYKKITNGWATDATLCKSFAVEIVKKQGYNKAIYIDSDILINDNIDDLIGSILENVQKLAAVPASPETDKSRESIEFNTGVLLFNLDNFTDKDFTDYNELAISSGNKMGDQYVYNMLYMYDYDRLDFTYNSVKRDNSKAKVLHFVGAKKPWNTYIAYDKRFAVYYDYVHLTNSKRDYHLIDLI